MHSQPCPTDPRLLVARSNLSTGFVLCPCIEARSNQGSVLAVRVFGSLSIYFTPQPEVVPRISGLYSGSNLSSHNPKSYIILLTRFVK